MTSTRTMVDVEGRTLRLTSLDKVLYPETGFTKGRVIDYYARIAPVILPHLAGRPLTLKRYPEGVGGAYFYEKNCPTHRPEWVRTAGVRSRTKDRINFCIAADLPTLIWVANLASLELHTYLHTVAGTGVPTTIAFDLDPGPPAGLLECLPVGLRLRRLLEELGLQSCPKVSGDKGLHVYVPLNTPTDYDATKSFARALAGVLQCQAPTGVTAAMRKDLRAGKVFVDWSQNDEHKTTVCAYSLRAMDRPLVSAPVTWEEISAADRAGDAHALRFDAGTVIERIEKHGDLFEPVLHLRQELPSL